MCDWTIFNRIFRMYAVGWFLYAEHPESIGKLVLFGSQIIINPKVRNFPDLNFFFNFQFLPLALVDFRRSLRNEVHSPGCNWNGQSYFGGWCEGRSSTEIGGNFLNAVESQRRLEVCRSNVFLHWLYSFTIHYLCLETCGLNDWCCLSYPGKLTNIFKYLL